MRRTKGQCMHPRKIGDTTFLCRLTYEHQCGHEYSIRIEDVERLVATAAQQRVAVLEKIEAAARNLVAVKGRHHSEIAYQALVAALASTEPTEKPTA